MKHLSISSFKMKKIIIIFLSVLIAILVAGKIADACYKKYWWPFFEKLDVVIKDSSYYDGVYTGDSRAHFGINPYYVDSLTGLNTYNVSMGGATINEINFLSQQYMNNHRPPKFAVISVGYSDILSANKFFENPCYYFFYSSDTAVGNTLQRLHYHTQLYKLLPFLKYTAFDDFNKLSILENLKGKTIVKQGGTAYKGFINNRTNTFNIQQIESFTPKDINIDSAIAVLEATIKLFASNNTLPILVYPPETHNNKKTKAPVEIKIDAAVSLLAGKYKIPLLHFDNDSDFTNDLFTDQWHLNLKGTILYSKKIGAGIKNILQ